MIRRQRNITSAIALALALTASGLREFCNGTNWALCAPGAIAGVDVLEIVPKRSCYGARNGPARLLL
jgi:hypothetical protein